ncbi:MAG: Ig-like domain-containing protein [Planctomycetota bacterium]|nr:Ig-like domain-containing protein [Planctomycetota bacterium]
MNGDGRPDLAVASIASDNVSVLLNTSAPGAAVPSFAAQQNFATGGNPRSVTVGDLNGDGRPDLVVANENSSTVSVLLNTTAPGAAVPSFATQQNFATGANPRSVAVGDLNGDGRPDLAVANAYSNSVSVLLNTTVPGAATASFAAPQDFATGAFPFSVTVGDLNGDGRPDLAVANGESSNVSVLLNQPATIGDNQGTGTILDNDSLTQIWTGAGRNGLWSTSDNWLGGVAPQAGARLLFPASTARSLAVTNDLPDGTEFQSITVAGSYVIGGNRVTLAPSDGTAIWTDVNVHDCIVTISLPITLAGDSAIVVSSGSLVVHSSIDTASHTLTVTANSSGPTTFDGFILGTGRMFLTGSDIVILTGDNHYTGGTLISGPLTAGSDTALGSGRVTIGTGGSLTVVVAAGDVVPLWNLTIGSLAGEPDSSVQLNNNTLTVGGDGTSTEFPGIIEGSGAVVKVGTGTLTLSGNNTYTGPTNFIAGTLLVNGSTTSSIFVDSGATLGGTGTIHGTVQVANAATLAPGFGPGILNTESVTFQRTSVFSVELNGAAAGSGYDQLNVSGSVFLGSAVLHNRKLAGFESPIGMQFMIIDNDGVDPVNGTFDSLPEGATVTLGGQLFTISYVAGTGNDVALIATTASGTISGQMFEDVNGNGLRDPGDPRDPGEPGLAGVRIYADLNLDGVYDAGTEPSALTMEEDPRIVGDQSGHYELTGLPPGAYRIREVVPIGFVQTFPSPAGSHGEYRVELASGGVIGQLDFGNQRLRPDNQAPLLRTTGAPTLSPILADVLDANNPGTLIGDIVGTAITDPNPGDPQGIAVIGVDNAHGLWQYSTGGSTWNSFASRSVTSAVLLSAGPLDRIRFIPRPGFSGTVDPGLTFRAWDQSDGLADGTAGVDATVTGGRSSFSTAVETAAITVTPVNGAPTAGNDMITTSEDTPAAIAVPTLLSNDSPGPANESGQTLRLVPNGLGMPSHGTAIISGANVIYTPAADFYGRDQFTYTIDDGDPSSTAVGTVTVTVTPVNDAPRLTAGNPPAVAEDAGPQSLANWATFSPGPANESGQSVRQYTVVNVSNPGLFSVAPAVAANGTLTYTPAADANGTSTFGVTVQDDGGTANGGNDISIVRDAATIVVRPVNDPPTAGNDAVTINEDTPATIAVPTLLSNDSPGPANESGQTLRLVPNGLGMPSHGTAIISDRSVIYTPAAGFYGVDTFTYTIDDGDPSATAVGTVTVTVTAVNDAPVLRTTGTPTLLPILADVLDANNPGTLIGDIVGTAITDPNPGDPQGIAVIGVDNAHGLWQYSTGGGTWNSFASRSVPTAAVLLSAGPLDRIRFVPRPGFSGTVDSGLTFRAWDQSDGLADGTVGVDASVGGGRSSFSAASETASIAVNVPAARLQLRVTDAAGREQATLLVGQSYVLEVYTEDLRPVPRGVLAAYLDVLYDATLVSLAGEIAFGAQYPDGHSGSTRTVGLLDEVGATARVDELGRGSFLLFRVPLTAVAAGRADFFINQAQATGHQVFLYGDAAHVPPQNVAAPPYGSPIIQPPWRNHVNQFDVSGDGVVTPSDVLLCISEINHRLYSNANSELPTNQPVGVPLIYLDVTGDNLVTPLDVLVIIYALNTRSALGGEGEAAAWALPVDVVSAPTLSLAGSDAGIAIAEHGAAWSSPLVGGQSPSAMDSRLESAAVLPWRLPRDSSAWPGRHGLADLPHGAVCEELPDGWVFEVEDTLTDIAADVADEWASTFPCP